MTGTVSCEGSSMQKTRSTSRTLKKCQTACEAALDQWMPFCCNGQHKTVCRERDHIYITLPMLHEEYPASLDSCIIA